MLPSTVTMSQWMTRPIAKFATTATVSTMAIARAANTKAPNQLRSSSLVEDLEEDVEVVLASLEAP
jgi:hypothetical protein